MDSQELTDWQGRPIPPNETPDTIIRAWEITPHPDASEYDSLIIRSWQLMLDYTSNHLDTWLEKFDDNEIQDGVALNFRVTEMTLAQYQEILQDN